MTDFVNRAPDTNSQPCRVCGEGVAALTWVVREVAYGLDGSLVKTEVALPTWECDFCEMSYLAEGAEELQHEAICKALGRLTPREIIAIRTDADLTQRDFAAELEVGIASLKRWELGLAIQDKRNDRILRGYVASAERVCTPTFRTTFAPRTFDRANRFRLRPDCAGLALAA